MSLDPDLVRSHFPALQRNLIFFDNPGGTQIADFSLERIREYLLNHNANHGGVFATSVESDAILEEAHRAMADFYNAASPQEIIFGANMTTLTLHISRSIARTWNPGDTIVVTRLDHDANVTPWMLAAEDRGCRVLWVDFHPEDGTLDLDSYRAALESSPRLVAIGYASNALGTINPVRRLIRWAHEAGAWVYVDAVQYAPHGPIDVQDLDCDFLVSSAYKFFGPHQGILYGKYELLDRLFPYKVRPAPSEPPGKFETGTQNHEAIAGVLGALEYLAWLGREFGAEREEDLLDRGYRGRALELKKAMQVIRGWEFELSRALLETLQEIPGLTLYGLTDPRRLDERVPTFAFRIGDLHPRVIAERLAAQGIAVWDGNYYAINVTERLGVEEKGGMVRVGAVHYNTLEEVDRLRNALFQIVKEMENE